MKPIRIQRKRTKGWKMPPNTVSVDRSTNWGNPYKDSPPELLVALFRDHLNDRESSMAQWKRDHLHALRGKNLACWCPLDQPCHADVLLELANGGDR